MISDIIQGVMVGLYSATPQFKYDPARGRFRGYLKVCTWRVLQANMEKLRGPDGRPLFSIDSSEAFVEHAWSDVWETENLRRAVGHGARTMPGPARSGRMFQAFSMYVLLERPAAEVAAELQMSVESVHQAKTRVSQLVKKAMETLQETVG